MGRGTSDEIQAQALIPLLESIRREVFERQNAVQALLRVGAVGIEGRAEIAWELSLHRRELARAEQELTRLGCSLVGRRPLTIRIRCAARTGPRSFLWQGEKLLAF